MNTLKIPVSDDPLDMFTVPKDGVAGVYIWGVEACNLRCAECLVANTGYSPKKFMEYGLAKAIVQLAVDLEGCRNLILFGGEPTLWTHFMDVCELARDLGGNKEGGFKTTVFTNGIKFASPRFTKEAIASGLDAVHLSIKGTCEHTYGEYTGMQEGFKLMLDGIRNLRAHDLEPNFEIVVNKHVIPHVREILIDLDALGVKRILVDFENVVLKDGVLNNAQTPSYWEFGRAVEAIHAAITDPNLALSIRPRIAMTFPFCFVRRDVLDGLIAMKLIDSFCYLVHGRAAIFKTEGELIACNHLNEQTLGKFGRDFSDAVSFLEYWNNALMREFRADCAHVPEGPCIDCELWHACGAGCTLRRSAGPLPHEQIPGLNPGQWEEAL